jgi:hypothetical protein
VARLEAPVDLEYYDNAGILRTIVRQIPRAARV